MKLIVIGLSHHTAPLETRERLAFSPAEKDSALRELAQLPHVKEAALVSTCNRVEVYAASPSEAAGLAELRSFLHRCRSVEPEILSRYLYEYAGRDAIRHLFRVASALDSMVLGESQILGQFKEAYGLAVRMGTVGTWLGRSMERAFGVAKRVRTETKIAEGSASVSRVAVDLAHRIFGDLSGWIVLLLGAGKMSSSAARYLRSEGVAEILVTNRTYERAQSLAAEMEGQARPWEDLDHLLELADVVIASTGAQEPVLRRNRIAALVKRRKHRPLFLIDIAVPRDIEPQVGELPNVFLYDIDDLQKVVSDNVRERRKEADLAEKIIEAEVREFGAWIDGQAVVPAIKDLRAQADAIVRAELERTLPALDERARAKVTAMAEAIASKLLHAPLTALRRDADLALALRKLFGLGEPAPCPPEKPASNDVVKTKKEGP